MITFLGMPSRTSGEIRGRQVASRIDGARFVDVHNPDWSVIEQNKLALFVRTWEPNLARALAKRGYVVGYEIADMPVGDAVFRGAEVKDLSAYAYAECYFFVVNNSVQKADLAAVSDKPAFVIPHHSTNFDGLAAPFRSAPKRVGYVGLPEQLSGRSDIEALCARHGAEFVSVHPGTREECDQVFRGLDVGIVFAEGDGTMRPRVVELMKRYKPNTKLTNFQSYGIPTICTPYQSYIEFGENACRFVDSKEAMLTTLEEFLTKPYARIEVANAAYATGQKFHVDAVVKGRYLPMIEGMTKWAFG